MIRGSAFQAIFNNNKENEYSIADNDKIKQLSIKDKEKKRSGSQ